MTGRRDAEVQQANVQQAIDELSDLRDELYLAGYEVAMPVEPDREQRIRELLAERFRDDDRT